MNDCSSILDDEFQILRVTSNLYNEVEELLVNVSVNQEFGCLINNIKESPIAIDELRKLIRHILSLGISFAIRHVESGRIVAGIANIIFNVKRKSSYYDISAQMRSPSMIRYIQMWDAVDSSFDINEHCQLDSTFEMEYMGTSPEFRGRGLATILCKHSFRLAKEMSQGTLQPELFAQLPEEMQIERPQAVVAITTSYTSRNMARKLEMQTVRKWHFSELRSLGGAIAEPGGEEPFQCAELQVIMT
ncbi:uncharacterized protein LOC128252767 [Drosophila gunungcola]|uniref:uncharacterized protein LOC128252767 n=1 Tax=Drosophila gunungcola TaxID=103775 RepID=UPI0022E463F3|nr:uncharacterized protein LOC128252767 [Drosophila gunungcola]